MSRLELCAYGGVENLVFNEDNSVEPPEANEVQVKILTWQLPACLGNVLMTS